MVRILTVALISIPFDVGLGVCTGAMINNKAINTQIMLTASHCFEDNNEQISDDLVSMTSFYFNAESFSCEDNAGPPTEETDVSWERGREWKSGYECIIDKT